MSTVWKAATIAATALAISACSNLNAYVPDTPTGPPTGPIDATFNLASARMPDISRTSGKLDGRPGSAVMAPTGS